MLYNPRWRDERPRKPYRNQIVLLIIGVLMWTVTIVSVFTNRLDVLLGSQAKPVSHLHR